MLRLMLSSSSRAIATRSMVVAVAQTSASTNIARSQHLRGSMAPFAMNWFSTTTGASNGAPADVPSTPAAEALLNVPKNLVRYVIGPKGKTAFSLTEQSGGGKILFTGEQTPQGEEVAKLTGTAEQVAKLKELVQKEVDSLKNDPKIQEAEKARNDPNRAAAAANSRAENDYLEEVIVDAQYVGFLIGKQGLILREMEQSTGAKIQYSNREDGAQERTARLRGTPAQVQAAKKLISEKIYAVAEEMRTGKRGAGARSARTQGQRESSRGPSPNDVKQVVEVPSECVGPLIGKGGKSLFQMQDKTGAKFNFAKEDHRQGAREVTIYGSEDQIRAACDLIQQRVRQVLDRAAEESGKQ